MDSQDVSVITELLEALTDGVIVSENDKATSHSSLKTLLKVISNILDNPDDDKFRQLPLHNGAIQRRIINVSGAEDFLSAIGFSRAGDNLSFQPVGDDWQLTLSTAREILASRLEAAVTAPRRGSSSSKNAADEEYEARMAEVRKRNEELKAKQQKELADRAELKKRMEAEQRERRERRTQGSQAVRRTFGANAATFSDIGVDLNSGGG